MTPRTLHVLLVAGEGEARDRLGDLLESCRRPAIQITPAPSVEEASLLAATQDIDVVILDQESAPEVERGMLRLPSALLALPVVVALHGESAADGNGAPPDGIADYLDVDSDPPHVVERLLSFASQRHAMLRTLREAESQLRAIVESISDGVMILGERDDVLYANPAVESTLERPLYEMLGAPSPLVLPRDTPAVIEFAGQSGTDRFLRVATIPILWERRQARLVTIHDMTAERAIQNSLRRARDEAERVAALKTSFLANMSHELRMPLASMIGYAQIILEGSEHEEQGEFARSIVDSGNRLLETITSILDLARLDAEAVKTEVRPLSVTAIAREAVGMLSSLASRKGLDLRIEEAGGDDTVNSDPSALRRILANLIGNAIKFTDEGSVTVRVSSDHDSVRTTVADTGKGIGEEFLPRLFDEFAQESTGIGRSHEGSGLGLAIARRLCDLIGADITVESSPGSGSTFTLSVPHEHTWTD